ncbi:MAG: ABC transporter substrate-binding protein [Gammaproteobacteria bacterium]|nr:ABC transporter substrate-binding protein [Gammaproteobacteria bacterium]
MRGLIFLLAGALALAGCGGDRAETAADGGSGAPPVRGVTKTDIIIGSHTDLSGPAAIWGIGATNGARMRFDEANEAGGVHGRLIRLVVEDTGYELARARQAADKLINRDGIFAMLMGLGTPMNNAITPRLFMAGVPNLFAGSGGRQMVEPFHPLKFTQRGIYYDEVRAAVRHFVENEGKRSVCVIHHESEYGHETLDAAEGQLAGMGMRLVARSSHKPSEEDFTDAVRHLRDAGCDMVAMGTVHRDTILILDAARRMGWEDVAWVGNNATYAQVIADHESGEGYYVFSHMAKLYPDDPKPPAVQAWWDKYRAKYRKDPGLAAMEGYRAADLTLLALENAGRELTVDGLVRGIEAIGDYKDIFGYSLFFSPERHHGVKASVLSQVRDGRFVVLEESVSY